MPAQQSAWNFLDLGRIWITPLIYTEEITTPAWACLLKARIR
jgi:hypothetical protein